MPSFPHIPLVRKHCPERLNYVSFLEDLLCTCMVEFEMGAAPGLVPKESRALVQGVRCGWDFLKAMSRRNACGRHFMNPAVHFDSQRRVLERIEHPY
jgi:hypothetical protein